jgi:hypothetical protein
MALKKRTPVGAFVRAFPLTAALTMSWSWGELIGCSTGCEFGECTGGLAERGDLAARSRADLRRRS